jgi:outer membrane lipoprotein SlyB
MMLPERKKIRINPSRRQRAATPCVWLLLLSAIVSLGGCYPASYRATIHEEAVAAPAPLAPQVYFYPKAGQTTEQQSRDHYECYQWAVTQTGFDPSQSSLPTDQRVRVVPMPPPGYDTAAMAIAGAVLGALIGGPRHAAGGALIGAAGGAIAGAASDSARQEYALQQEEAYAARDRSRNARSNTRVAEFRRAMSACLEGRGYSVQ